MNNRTFSVESALLLCFWWEQLMKQHSNIARVEHRWGYTQRTYGEMKSVVCTESKFGQESGRK